jgi:death-on-curing protein
VTAAEAVEAPAWIAGATPLAIHAQQVERYGGAHGVADLESLLSAVADPVARWSDDPWADLADVAAAYLISFVRRGGFREGNRRTGLAMALTFLSLNNSPLHVPPAELYALTMAVESGRANETAVAAYFRNRLAVAH